MNSSDEFIVILNNKKTSNLPHYTNENVIVKGKSRYLSALGSVPF